MINKEFPNFLNTFWFDIFFATEEIWFLVHDNFSCWTFYEKDEWWFRGWLWKDRLKNSWIEKDIHLNRQFLFSVHLTFFLSVFIIKSLTFIKNFHRSTIKQKLLKIKIMITLNGWSKQGLILWHAMSTIVISSVTLHSRKLWQLLSNYFIQLAHFISTFCQNKHKRINHGQSRMNMMQKLQSLCNYYKSWCCVEY